VAYEGDRATPKTFGGGFGHPHFGHRGWPNQPQIGLVVVEPPPLAKMGWPATPTNLQFFLKKKFILGLVFYYL
jgi:hypothetical protein